MRRHPELGARILEHADLRDIAGWVRAHHERLDGRGYPRGAGRRRDPARGADPRRRRRLRGDDRRPPLPRRARPPRRATSCAAARARSSTTTSSRSSCGSWRARRRSRLSRSPRRGPRTGGRPPGWPERGRQYPRRMRIGTALTLVAVGLVLSYAIDFDVPGIDLRVLGSILFFVGLLGLLVSVGMEIAAQRARTPRPRASRASPAAESGRPGSAPTGRRRCRMTRSSPRGGRRVATTTRPRACSTTRRVGFPPMTDEPREPTTHRGPPRRRPAPPASRATSPSPTRSRASCCCTRAASTRA